MDGEPIATNTGWLAWAEFATTKAEDFPLAAHLAQEGYLEPADNLEALADELEELRDLGPAALAGITAHLLAALKDRLEGCVALIVTDGTEGGEDLPPED